MLFSTGVLFYFVFQIKNEYANKGTPPLPTSDITRVPENKDVESDIMKGISKK